jgi:hypothetical protein
MMAVGVVVVPALNSFPSVSLRGKFGAAQKGLITIC